MSGFHISDQNFRETWNTKVCGSPGRHLRRGDGEDIPASLPLLQSLMKDFSEAVIRIGERDHHLSGPQHSWYSILVAARPVDPLSIPDGD